MIQLEVRMWMEHHEINEFQDDAQSIVPSQLAVSKHHIPGVNGKREDTIQMQNSKKEETFKSLT